MFLFLPFAFFDSVQRDGNNLFDVKNDYARTVSKERKSTRFFHSITKQRRAWTEVDTVIGKVESQPCRRCSQNRRKTQTESGDRTEEKRLTSVPTEFIAIFQNVDIRLESIRHC